MRDTRAGWPRLALLAAVGALTWWGTTQLTPDPGKLAEVSFQKLARSALADVLPTDAQGDDGKVVVSAIATTWAPDCQAAVEPLLAKTVKVDRNAATAAGSLTLTCTREGRQLRVEAVFTPAPAKGAAKDRAPPETTRADVSTSLPDNTSLLPPLLAVIVAFATRRVMASLLGAIILGALFVSDFAPWEALKLTANDYIWSGASDLFNLYIFGFTLALVGAIHVCIAMGGIQGIIDAIAKVATNLKRTQVATALLGMAVFFDDYANTVIVGSSARPLTDAQRISREKLAYIVDSTAAPVAGVAIVSTWIGYEIGLFSGEMDSFSHIANSGYDFFFEVLPYRFYCYFAVALVFIIALSGRDFGAMYSAEVRARSGQVAPRPARTLSGARLSETFPREGVPHRWLNGVLPLVTVLLGAFVAFTVVGAGRLAEKGRDIAWYSLSDLGDAFTAVGDDNMAILFWAAIAGTLVAFGLAWGQRLLTVQESLRAFWRGVRSMLPAIAILVLAIGIRNVTVDMGTERFLAALLSNTALWLLPLLTFLLAAGVAFATGTSWGTMGILLPVAIPLAASLVTASGDPAMDIVIILVAGSVLDGAIFGDHCSLISDTTVMSSMACSCDHIEHVRTQVPYALLAMAAASLGYLLLAVDGGLVPVWVCYLLGLALMMVFVRFRGRVARRPTAP